MTRYPRDMLGHGPTPPDAQWPNGARIAVQFVINYEEGGENNVFMAMLRPRRFCQRSLVLPRGRAAALEHGIDL